MIKIKTFFVFFICYFIFSLNGFSQYYYASNEGSLLALNEKNDFKGSIAVGRNSYIGKNMSYQIGYSPLNNIAFQFSYFAYKADPVQERKFSSGNLFNGAIGTYYFLPIGKHRNTSIHKDLLMKKGIMADLYMGYGKGNMFNNYIGAKASKLFFNKPFIQGGLHWQTGTLAVDYVTKFGFLDYYKTEIYGFGSQQPTTGIENFELYDTFSYREHSVRIRLQLKIMGVFMTRTWINHSDRGAKFIDNATHFGMLLELDEIFKKKKEK